MPTAKKRTRKKVTTVREHPMRVPVSSKNPKGITIRDQHVRRLEGTYLDAEKIASIFKNYDRKNIVYPAAGKRNPTATETNTTPKSRYRRTFSTRNSRRSHRWIPM